MKQLVTLCLTALLATGCASITQDAKQTITVATKDTVGATVLGAKCVFKNDKGEARLDTTPGNAFVDRSSADMEVTCKKEGVADGTARLISRAGRIWGNIILGGGIGAIVDHNTGKGYNYPDIIDIIMGQLTVYDRSNQEDGKPTKAGATTPSTIK
jgi:uncharacterized protein YfiM (DUF2279 family)